MTLLTINGHDYTKNITVPSWAVSNLEVATTWTDGNSVTHRDVIRHRVTGQFTFKDRNGGADYTAFLADLAAVRTNTNAYTITVYCNNTEASETIDAFLTWTPNQTRVAGGPVVMDAFIVNIEER